VGYGRPAAVTPYVTGWIRAVRRYSGRSVAALAGVLCPFCRRCTDSKWSCSLHGFLPRFATEHDCFTVAAATFPLEVGLRRRSVDFYRAELGGGAPPIWLNIRGLWRPR
jgi:hypothetical protein